MTTTLTLVSGLAWTLVYLECIRVGRRDGTYAMPVAALALNIAWEVLYSGYGLTHGGGVSAVVTTVWAVLDLGIVWTWLRYGRRELPGWVTPGLFAGWSALLLVTAVVVQVVFAGEFGFHLAARYSAFLQNLLMSGLFLAMLVSRGGSRGQSPTIAVAKWIGTLAPTISYGMLENSPLVLGTGLLCSVFDLLYLALLVSPQWRSTSSTATSSA